VDAEDDAAAVRVLEQRGYRVETDWRPVRVEFAASGLRWVDLHPVVFDASGNGRQADLDGGRDVGAEFLEVVLLNDPQDAAERFTRRSAQSETAEHQNAAALLERRGGLDALPGMYDRLLQVVAARPRTRVVLTVDGEVERAYHDLFARIST